MLTRTTPAITRAFSIAACSCVAGALGAHAQPCVSLLSAPAGLTPGYQLMTNQLSIPTDLRPLETVLPQGGHGGGPGGVFADLNNDGYPELYLMRGDPNGSGTYSENQLFINIPDGLGGRLLQQLPETNGAADSGESTGAVAADYDNDGDVDIFVTNYNQPDRLLRNMFMELGAPPDPMNLAFTDVTLAAGVNVESFATGDAACPIVPLDNSLSAAWSDVNRDGFVDLYVATHNGAVGTNEAFDCPARGQRDTLFLNNGDGSFTDVSETYNVTGYETAAGSPVSGCGHTYASSISCTFADFNNDRWPDLLVANITHGACDRDMIYINKGADEFGVWQGYDQVSYDIGFENFSQRAMGVDVGDIDNDGDIDIYITDSTTFQNDLWINQLSQSPAGELSFVHCTSLAAVMSWGTQMADFDNNGWLDIYVATQRDLRDHLYLNMDGANFFEAAIELGAAVCDDVDCTDTPNSRSCMAGDLDQDGWVEIVVINRSRMPSIMMNELASQCPQNTYFALKLTGDPNAPGLFASSRDAIGARARISADLDGDGVIGANETQLREVRSGSSNAATTAPLDLEFGVGEAASLSVEILWPSGRRSAFFASASQRLTIDESQIINGDFDANGFIGSADLGTLLGSWGPCPAAPTVCPADLDGDGMAGSADLALLLGAWNAT